MIFFLCFSFNCPTKLINNTGHMTKKHRLCPTVTVFFIFHLLLTSDVFILNQNTYKSIGLFSIRHFFLFHFRDICTQRFDLYCSVCSILLVRKFEKQSSCLRQIYGHFNVYIALKNETKWFRNYLDKCTQR